MENVTYSVTKYSNATSVNYDVRGVSVVRRSDGEYNLVLKNLNEMEDKPFIYKDGLLVIGISTAGLEGLKFALEGWEKLIPTEKPQQENE